MILMLLVGFTWSTCKVMASIIRVDKETETGVMATMHTYLHQQHKDEMHPIETVIYTSNQVGKLI